MKKDVLWKLAPVAGAVVLVLGVVGMFCFSGRDISIESVVALVVAAAGALGLGAAGMRNGGGGGASAGGAIVLLAASSILSGCSGAQHVVSAEDCALEQRILLSVEATVDAVDYALPPGIEGREETLAYSREGLAIGAAAVEACEAHRDADPWITWVGIGLKILRGLVAILRMAGVEAPGALGEVLDLLVAADRAPPALVSIEQIHPVEW